MAGDIKESGFKVEWIPVKKLKPAVYNPRKDLQPDDLEYVKIQKSLNEFGLVDPLVVNKDMSVFAGHQRLKVLIDAGFDKVPCSIVDLDKTKEKALNIALNKIAGMWDFPKLTDLLTELNTGAFDLEAIGFSDDELEALLVDKEGGLTDEDAVPEVPDDPITKVGDLWLMGEHRCLCGDATKREDVELLMGGVKADVCLTDPPYGIGDTKSDKNNYSGYDDSKVNLEKLIGAFLPLAQEVAPVVVLTPGNGNHRLYPNPTWTMAWFTPAGVGSGPWGFCCWQPILCYGKDPKLAKAKGRHPDAIVHTETAGDFGHPCAKPINFWGWLMDRVSESGGLIYDPFAGSGTTLIAAEQTGRTAHLCEIDPHYCDVIKTRYEDFTGNKAELSK